MSEERTVEVPVQLVGEAVGAKEGGVVEQPLFNRSNCYSRQYSRSNRSRHYWN